MKALFLNPPWFSVDGSGRLLKGVRAGSRWANTNPAVSRPGVYTFGPYVPTPFFLMAAASYVQKFTGAEVKIRDSIALHETYLSFYNWVIAQNADFIFIESTTPTWEHDVKLIRRIHELCPNAKLVVCGTIVTTRAKEIMETLPVVACIKGEYEKSSVRVVNGETGIFENDLLTQEEMNAAPFPMYDASTAWRYFDACPSPAKTPHAHVWASRGCGFKCLSGDTPVNTVEGMIPIRDLVGREGLGVFTYDPIEKRAKVCTARNIRQYGAGDTLVRVHFDDGTHTDCTPDHRFLAFKWGNQFTGEKEWQCEAKDLKPGMHLRALKLQSGGAYIDAAWTRYGRAKIHRMIAEWKIGRRLTETEQVHHKDHNKLNNLPDNLEVCANAKEHFANHPEIAQRMRYNNPTKKMTPEWKAKIKAAQKGKKMSEATKAKMKIAAQAREDAKTPEQKHAHAMKSAATTKALGRRYRGGVRSENGQFVVDNGIVNHRVVSVEVLPGTHDTYCLEVPETGWFYANNVLVRNCSHCEWPASMTGNDPDGTGRRFVRYYSADYMEKFLREIIEKYRFQSIYFDDDTFNLNNKHTLRMCEVMKRIGIPWSAMCRADTIPLETWKVMRDSGCFGFKIGMESGSQRIVTRVINKQLDIADVENRILPYIKELGGMSVHTTWMLGHPGETPEEAEMTKAMIARFYEKGLHHTHQLSGCAELEGTPVHTVRDGPLAKYPDMKMDANYRHGTDGNAKIAQIRNNRASEEEPEAVGDL